MDEAGIGVVEQRLPFQRPTLRGGDGSTDGDEVKLAGQRAVGIGGGHAARIDPGLAHLVDDQIKYLGILADDQHLWLSVEPVKLRFLAHESILLSLSGLSHSSSTLVEVKTHARDSSRPDGR